jgi:hypothetical protein
VSVFDCVVYCSSRRVCVCVVEFGRCCDICQPMSVVLWSVWQFANLCQFPNKYYLLVFLLCLFVSLAFQNGKFAMGFSGDIGDGPTTAYDALPPKPWKNSAP